MNHQPLGEILVRQGLVSKAQVEEAVASQQASGRPLGDTLVALGMLDEASLLRALAEQHGVSYVSRAQVAESPVPPECLEVVPLDEAERHCIFPVWYNSASGELVLVVADPTDRDVIERVRKRVQTPVVTTILALSSTIRAAIDKHYRGIADAFERAEPEPEPVPVPEPMPPPEPEPAARRAASEDAEWQQDVRRLAKLRQGAAASTAPVVERSDDVLVLLFEPDRGRADATRAFLEAEGFRVVAAGDAGVVPELTRREKPSVILLREETATADPEVVPLLGRLLPLATVRRVVGYGDILTEGDPRLQEMVAATLETLDLLLRVAGLEEGKGPSGPTPPRLARQVGQRLGLAPEHLDELSVAAYMRELAREELTWPSIVDLDRPVERDRILQEVRLPIKHLVHLGIPVPATHVLAHLYERFDGTGLPDGLSGNQIPLGARILSVIAAFQRLAGDRIPDTREEVEQAFRGLVERSDRDFDPVVLNAFLEVLEKGLLLGEIDVGIDKVLIVDPDAAFATRLSSALLAKGRRVLRAETVERAREILRDYLVDVVVAEVRMPDGDPLALVSELRDSDGPPVVFVTGEQDQAVMGQALELGAEDYVLKIVGDKVIQAKIDRILERMSRERTRRQSASQGVAGRLSEMGLTDIIQVLGSSGKTARVDLAGQGLEGSIWVRAGEIVHATVGPGSEEGEDAFYRLIRLTEGEFQIENVNEIERETIEGNYEMLMLEGLRRMDEAGAGDELEEGS